MKKIAFAMSIIGIFCNVQVNAMVTSADLQADITIAFNKIRDNDSSGLSTVVKKYKDAPSVRTMLTSVSDGKTLLHAAAPVSDRMCDLLIGQARKYCGSGFALEVINAKDSQGKTAYDCAMAALNVKSASIINSRMQMALAQGGSSSSSSPVQAPLPSLDVQVNNTFAAVNAGNYDAMFAIIKMYDKYPEAATQLLTAKQSGKTLLHAVAANVANGIVASNMASRILNQALLVNRAFRSQVLNALDDSSKKAIDYVNERIAAATAAGSNTSELVYIKDVLKELQ